MIKIGFDLWKGLCSPRLSEIAENEGVKPIDFVFSEDTWWALESGYNPIYLYIADKYRDALRKGLKEPVCL